MKSQINGAPAFAHVHLDLDPGEQVTAEADAMSSMDAGLEMSTSFNGGFVSGVARRVFGGESLFVNTFTNTSQRPQRITFTQATPGDIREVDLNGQSLCFQPGAYLASTPGVNLGMDYAGIASFLGKEGLFKLQVSGTGKVWFGAYGGLVEKEIDGEYIVDTSHLVAYDPGMKLKVQLAGGIFSSFFGGEGLVTRVEGKGRIIIQSRSMDGLASWLNPKLW